MPLMDESLENDNLAQVLFYGASKTRKSWLALLIAELGFNVIYCDTDHSFQVAGNLSPEARKRIYRLDMRAAVSGYKNSGAHSMIKAAQGEPVYFDEVEREYVPKNKLVADKEYARLDFAALTKRDVLIIDSWTAVCQYLSAGVKNVFDLTAIDKLEWDDIAKIRLVLDLFLANLTKLNCHVIVIGHEETYGKRKKDAPAKAAPEQAYDSIRVQPMSISRPHAETLAKNFTDVFHLYIPSSSLGTMISSKGSEDFDAGSRSYPPGVIKFADFDWRKLVSPASLAAVADNKEYTSLGVTTVTGAQVKENSAQAASEGAIKVDAKPSILNLAKHK
jgi:hypothetical protein